MPKNMRYSEKTLVRMTTNRFKELVSEIRVSNTRNKFFTDAFGTEEIYFSFDIKCKKDLQVLCDSLRTNAKITQIYKEITSYYDIPGFDDSVIVQANDIIQVGLLSEEIST